MVLVIGLAPYLLALFLFGLLTRFAISRKKVRYFVNILAILGVWLYLFGDTIPLRYEFYLLCKNEAGYKIYQQINQSINEFTDDNGEVDWQKVEDNFVIKSNSSYLDKKRRAIKKLSQEFYFLDQIIGQVVSFSYGGGAYMRKLPTGFSCPDNFSYKEFYSEIYKGDTK